MGIPLKNPPVYFTMAQARFNALLNLDAYLASIQDAMRKADFPDFSSRKTFTLQINASERPGTLPNLGSIDQFLFGNTGRTHRFILNPDSLTLQSTRYGRFEEFSARFQQGLATIHEIAKLDFTDRVGLRYLNNVVPRPDDNLDQYVARGVRGSDPPLNGEVVYSFSETFCHIGDVRLRSRVFIQQGQLAFPPDVMADGMEIEKRLRENSGRHATLDVDGIVNKRVAFSRDMVGQHLRTIHEVTDAAFKSAVTDHALKAWDEQ